jgi:hypothetical protein
MLSSRSLLRPCCLGVIAALGSLAALGATAGEASAGAGTAHAAATPACQTAGLVVWIDTQANGAAGHLIYTLNFTNLSGHKCTLRGYPGISGVSITGGQLGAAATKDAVRPVKTITLRNGRTATTLVQITDVGVFSPSTCKPVTAAGLRVFPPNQTASKMVPFPFQACSRSAVGYIGVQAVR